MKEQKQPKKKTKKSLEEKLENVKQAKRKAADALDEDTLPSGQSLSHIILNSEQHRTKIQKLLKELKREVDLEKEKNSKDDSVQEDAKDRETTDEELSGDSDAASVESVEVCTKA